MKITHWETSFFKYIEAAEKRSFLWGEFDCCLFVAGGVEAITGVDCAATYPPAYDSEQAARDYVETFGGIAALFDTAFFPIGGTKVLPLYAKRGDVMVLDLPTGDTTETMGALCLGRDVAFLTDQGLRSISLTAAAQLSAQVWSF